MPSISALTRCRLLLLVLMGGSGLSLQAAAPEPRFNVLYIVADDLSAILGCYGNPVVHSPNLDRLAARGMRFDRAYCNYPVCNPSRVSSLSGLRPETTRVVDLKTPTRAHVGDAVFLPELFRKSGYRTVKVGKIYHTGDGFEDPRSWDIDIRETEEGKNPPAAQILRRQGPDGIVLRAKDEDTWDGFVARRAVTLLEETVKTGAPFFLAAGFRMPHRPYIAPEKYYALYNPDELQPRPGSPKHLENIPPLALTYRSGATNQFPTERPGDTIAAYYAAISYMDAQVGVLLEALDRLGLWERTIVVFQSDHGYHLGEHGGLWHKLSLFEECARIPLLVAAPGHKPGASFRLVELVDIYPTLADLCGLRAPAGLEGTSFRPLLENPAQPWKTAVFTIVAPPPPGSGPDRPKIGDLSALGRSVFDGRWRYTTWPDGTAQLYDHHHDPFEYDNLAGNPAAASQVERMKQLLAAGWKSAVPGARTNIHGAQTSRSR